MASLGFPGRRCDGTPVVDNVSWRSRGRSSTYVFGRVVAPGSSPVTTVGFCWSETPAPAPECTAPPARNTLRAFGGRAGTEFVLHPRVNDFGTVYGRLYAINARGCVGYAPLIALFVPCFVAGTQIAVRDPETGAILQKRVESVGYADEVLTWDFQHGRLAAHKPAWIKAPAATTRHQALTFSNDATLRVVENHRVFNAATDQFTQSGKRATPFGTRTFTLEDALAFNARRDDGDVDSEGTRLVSHAAIDDDKAPVQFYNLLVGGGHRPSRG
jgi:hypothetical protein